MKCDVIGAVRNFQASCVRDEGQVEGVQPTLSTNNYSSDSAFLFSVSPIYDIFSQNLYSDESFLRIEPSIV